MTNWINQNKESIIRISFLVPILSVAIISISHVVRWYDLANPISWAIYLSIAVEIAALSSIAAASVKVKGFSVWLVFIIVTLIQFIGNIYFSYAEIDVKTSEFKNWAELTGPLFESFSDIEDVVAQRRLLAILEGGLLPLISLTCLHFFIKYGDRDLEKSVVYTEQENIEDSQEKIEEYKDSDLQQEVELSLDGESEPDEKESLIPDSIKEENVDKPTSSTNSRYRNRDIPPIINTVQFNEPGTTPNERSELNDVKPGVSLIKRPLPGNNKLGR